MKELYARVMHELISLVSDACRSDLTQGMQCRWVLGREHCLKGSGPVAQTMPSQLRAGVPPLRPQLRVGAAPPNKKIHEIIRCSSKGSITWPASILCQI